MHVLIRSLLSVRVGLVTSALALVWSQGAVAAPVAFTGGADDEIAINVGQTEGKYFRLKTDDDHLKLKAEGPIVIALRARALTAEPATGVIRILRDDGPYSDNPYKLARDANAVPDAAAKVDGNAVTTEKLIYVHVGEGQHRYSISALRGPPLALRLFKVTTADPKFDAQPEKNTLTGASPAPETATPPAKTELPVKPVAVAPVAKVEPPAAPAAKPSPAVASASDVKPVQAPPPKPVAPPPAPPPAPKPVAPPAPKPPPPPAPPKAAPEAKPATPSPAPPAKPASHPDAGPEDPFGDLPPIE